ncbi:MAG: efflux RND transporter permease subunit [Chromatiales bacterium]|nr:efflux RND transporter permease subunit [Chromatiales bacterium]
MIRTAIQRPISTLVLILGLALFGVTNLTRLPVDFLPDITYPLIKLSIAWTGATPEDIDRNLADPIERQLAAVDGLDYLSSSAIEGLYQLDVNFRYGVDVDTAYQDALAAFARAQRDLPSDIEPPIIIKADPSQLPVVQVAFESERQDLTQLRTWVDNWLTDRLLAAGGVAGVDVAGGLEREIRVLIDRVALEKYGLSLELIERRLKRGEPDPARRARDRRRTSETIVRTLGEYQDLETIRDILIARTETAAAACCATSPGVEDSHEEARLITRLDGRPAVKVNIIKQADANTVETVRGSTRPARRTGTGLPGRDAVRAAGEPGRLHRKLDPWRRAQHRGRSGRCWSSSRCCVFLGSPRQVFIIAVVIPITLADQRVRDASGRVLAQHLLARRHGDRHRHHARCRHHRAGEHHPSAPRASR